MLKTINPKVVCPTCQGKCKKKRPCDACGTKGFAPIETANAWSGSPAFLVCGGPSLRDLPTAKLGMRGVLSLGVNNCSASVPVRAWTFSDPQYKFHHSLFMDGSVTTFCPSPMLTRHVRFQQQDGSWVFARRRVMDCPNTIGYERSAAFCPDEFLTSWFAQWGMGGHQHKKGDAYRAMMLPCEACGRSGICPVCRGAKCEKCLITRKGNANGKCRKCSGVGLLRPFTRQATMLVGLRLLCHLGANPIYVVGVDFFRESKQDGYGFDEAGSGGTGVYEKENKMLCMVQPVLKRAGIEVFNCSDISRCTAFPRFDFDEAIKHCTQFTRNVRTRGWYAKTDVKKWKDIPVDQWPAVDDLVL